MNGPTRKVLEMQDEIRKIMTPEVAAFLIELNQRCGEDLMFIFGTALGRVMRNGASVDDVAKFASVMLEMFNTPGEHDA